MNKKMIITATIGFLLFNLAESAFTVKNASGEGQQVSTVGYGLVTAKIKKNVTTQEDIIMLLGAPNITTTDAEGSETWVYDKVSTETVQQGKIEGEGSRSTKVDTTGQSREFGANILIAGYKQGRAQGAGSAETHEKVSAENEIKRTTMTKNFTLIIKFNEDKTVKTYSVRAANF